MKRLFIFFLFFSVVSQSLFGRWTDQSGYGYENEFIREFFDVKQDGAYQYILEQQIHILDAEGLKQANNVSFTYSQSKDSLEVLSAKTINQGKEISVPDSLIERKPIASIPGTLSDTMQLSIIYPGLEVGSRIYFKIKLLTEIKKATLTEFFTHTFIFSGNQPLIQKAEIEIKAKTPLFVEWNDPDQILEMNQSSDKLRFTARIRTPYLKTVADENDSILEPELLPWIRVSTTDDWQKAFGPVSAAYEQRLKEPLPPEFQAIAFAVKDMPKDFRLINEVTARLSNVLHYFSDTRAMKEWMIPKSLSEISENKFGDCKTFALATTAILRNVGIQSHVAVVELGQYRFLPFRKLLSFDLFNHAITWAKLGEREYWIDATYGKSFAQGILNEIADRVSIILSPKVRLAHIPSVNYRLNVTSEKINFELQKSGEFIPFRATLAAMGAHSHRYLGIKENQDYQILGDIRLADKAVTYDFEPYETQSTTTKDLHFSVKGTLREPFVKTSAGHGFIWDAGTNVKKLLYKMNERVSSLDLGQPGVYHYMHRLSGAKLIGKGHSCSVKSPWFEGSRTIRSFRDRVEAYENYEFKKSVIPIVEIRKSDFLSFQEKLKNCFSDHIVLFKAVKRASVKHLVR